MLPVNFEGATEIKKPESMTDEQCMSIWAKRGFGKLFQLSEISQSESVVVSVAAGKDEADYPYYVTAWKPSYEDLQAMNRGEPIYIKTLSTGLPPMAVFTLNENNELN